MSKALTVCDTYSRSIKLHTDSNAYIEPLELRNLGGRAIPTCGSSFTCNYALLGNDPARVPENIHESRKFIEESFENFDLAGSKCYLPDLQLIRRRCPENSLDQSVYLTVEIKSKPIDTNTEAEAWTQALVGLQHCSHTYALIMSLYEAKLLKLQLLDDNTILTSEKSYYFDVEGSNMYQTSVLVDIFRDIVQIIWERTFNQVDF